MKKIIIQGGSAFWLEGDVLHYAPINADNSIAMDESGEVEVFDEIENLEALRASLA